MAENKPLTVPLAVQPNNRASTATATGKDAKIVNAYLEHDEATNEWWAVKRPGLKKFSQPDTQYGQGIGTWRGTPYAVVHTKLYRIGSDGTATSIGTVTNMGTGLSQITSWGYPNDVGYIVPWNLSAAYIYDGTTLSQLSGANFPTYPKGMAFLEGTLYTIDITGTIFGSAINAPTTWTDTTNRIVNYPILNASTGLVSFAKYIVAFSGSAMTPYWNAGNPTGSPLSPISSSAEEVGLYSYSTIAQIGNALVWLGQSKQGILGVYSLGLDLSVHKVSTPAVERLLSRFSTSTNTLWGYAAIFSGHQCYVISVVGLLAAYGGPASSSLTLVYDFTVKKWYQWTWYDGTPLNFVGSTTSASVGHSDSSDSLSSLFIHPLDGEIYTLDSSLYTDDDGQFTVDIVTPNIDGGTRFVKTLGRLDVVGDQVTDSMLQLRWSDDDYQTWSDFQNLDAGLDLVKQTNLGSFTKRAFHLRQSSNHAFRGKRLDLYMDLGVS